MKFYLSGFGKSELNDFGQTSIRRSVFLTGTVPDAEKRQGRSAYVRRHEPSPLPQNLPFVNRQNWRFSFLILCIYFG